MIDQTELEEGQGSGFLNYIPAILWQRKWFIIPPFVLLFAAGIIAALLLPTVYRSSASLLVQSQELPTELVDSPASSRIDQRIAKIRQQVLSRGDLIELIEQIDLYNDARQSEPMSQIIDRMRDATSIRAVAGDIGQGGNGNQSNTVAFQMSFDYRDPSKAQAVMQSFVTRFLQLDTSNLADQAAGTVSFLQDQANSLQQQIGRIEQQITAIKAQNGVALSSYGGMPIADSGSYDSQIIALQNQNRALSLQLQKSAKDPMVEAAEAQLAAARLTYAENHPDVVLAKQRLAQLKAGGSTGSSDRAADASAIRSQIAANNTTIASLQSSRSSDRSRASAALAANVRGPMVAQQVSQLEGRADILRTQYSSVSANLLKAQGSAQMTQEQKGERLSVIDPPSVPDKPVSPNRPLLILGGAVAGLGIGIVFAMLMEFVMRPVRGAAMIENMGLEPIGIVPTLKPDSSDGTRSFMGFRRKPSMPMQTS